MSDIIDVQTSEEKAEGLKAWGWVSYVLHLIVAVAAVVPGAQPSAALLIIALVLDLVKRGDAEGTPIICKSTVICSCCRKVNCTSSNSKRSASSICDTCSACSCNT